MDVDPHPAAPPPERDRPERRVKAVQAEEAPNVFTDATFIYTVSGEDIPPADVERAIDLALTKYCSASIMLKRWHERRHGITL